MLETLASVAISTLDSRPFSSKMSVTKEASPLGAPEANWYEAVKTCLSLEKQIGHEEQPRAEPTQKSANAPQTCLRLTVLGRWLIFEDADGFGRLALQFECLPDFFAVEIFADGPGDFAGVLVFFVGQEVRRLDVVHHDRRVADANLPRELAEDETRRRFRGLEVAIGFAEIICVIDEAMRRASVRLCRRRCRSSGLGIR